MEFSRSAGGRPCSIQTFPAATLLSRRTVKSE